MSKKAFIVQISTSEVHEYRVPDCNTPEEAESIAEAWFADGEEGEVTEVDIMDTTSAEDVGEVE